MCVYVCMHACACIDMIELHSSVNTYAYMRMYVSVYVISALVQSLEKLQT